MDRIKSTGDFPGGSIPGWGTKIPHAVQQINSHATTTELVRLN